MRAWSFALAVSLVTGCNTIAGINVPTDREDSADGGASAEGGAASGSGGPAADPSPFLGSWVASAASSSYTCGGSSKNTETVELSLAITLGAAGALSARLSPEPSCELSLAVSGATATSTTPTSCTSPDFSTYALKNVVATLVNGTLSFTASGDGAESQEPCSFELVGTFTRAL